MPTRSLPILYRPDKPALSFGLQVIDWCESHLIQPDGPDAGDPFRFTAEQKAFVWRLYAVDARGRFLWNRAVMRRAKGWGKSPFLAALALCELLGPVRFSHFHAGQPIAKPVTMSWVQIAGVSEKQTLNTMSMVLALLSEDTKAKYDVDPGVTRVLALGGSCRLEPITASATTAEGARPSFVVLDETHHWMSANGGHKLAQTIRRNLGKSRDGSARSIETTNAHAMGMDSVAEQSYEAWSKQAGGTARGSTILYDSREAPPEIVLADREWLLEALAGVYGDSTWVDLERIVDEIYDPNTSPSEARRFYLNQLQVAEDAWCRPTEWDELASTDLKLADGEMITLGFDGSKSFDLCVLIAIRVSDGAWFTLGAWDPADYQDEAPRELIDEAIAAARGRYDVVGFYSDVHPFESYLDKWAVDFGAMDKRQQLCATATGKHPIAWDMRTRTKEFTHALEKMYQEIIEGSFRHDGHPVVRQHVHNARRRPNSWGVSVGKETRQSARHIDAVPAGCLARLARTDYLALPKSKQRRIRTGRAAF